MNLAPVLRQRFLDSNGLPLSGGKLYSYAAGTTTPLATYSSATGTTNANPVVLDSSGYADVFLDPTLAYKFKLTDSSANVLWTVDNVTYAVGITTWNSNSIYSQGSLVIDSSGQGQLYVSLINSNQNQPLTNASAWRMTAGNVRTVATNTTLAVTDDVVRSNSTSGNLTHTLPASGTTPIGKQITVVDIGSGSNTTTVNSVAFTSGTAGTFKNNGSSWDNVSGYGIPAGAVGTNQLAALAVTAAKIATDAVTTAKILNANVTAVKLASGVATGPLPSAHTNAVTTSTTLSASANQVIVGFVLVGSADMTVSTLSFVKTVLANTMDFFIIPPGQAVAFGSSVSFTLRYVTLANNT